MIMEFIVRECNLNFEAKQCVIYPTVGDPLRFTGDDFDRFLPCLSIIEAGCVKTKQEIEKEKQDRITQLDKEIAEKQLEKEALTKEEVKDE